jgi:RNA polymerase sigma-70 factor (ECF subfamily)
MLVSQRLSVEELAREYSRRVYNFCRSVLRNEADAEDAVQEVFLTLTRRRDELAAVERMQAWIMKVALLTCHWVRRKRGRLVTTDTEPDAAADPGPPIDASEDVGRLRAVIGTLPDRYREVLTLHYQQGLTHEEISDVLGISRGAMRVLLHRAVAKLRSEVKR